ncbi:MAG: ABC transporter substrate-binding protein [Actinomycetota bacterium]
MTDLDRLLSSLGRETRRKMTRRDLLRMMGRGGALAGMGAFLAACGVQAQKRDDSSGPSQLPPLATELVIANWPLYINQTQKGHSGTVQRFENETGIDVTYREVIEDNDTFFGTIREPLAQGQSTGWDIVVLSDWLIAKMIRLGFLEELHLDRLATFDENAGSDYRDQPFDPGNRYSIPWQAGITGIGYNPELTGREITSIEDLFDSAFEGHVGMFLEMRDTFGLALLSQGIVPDEATIEEVEKAQQKLLEQRDAGIVRGYYGNEYADGLARGDLWLTMAWSGDIYNLNFDNPELRFVVPEEGANRWIDNMAIPVGAEHPTDAHEWMDFVYQPDVAAAIAQYVGYTSPVPAIKDIFTQAASDATSAGDRRFYENLVESPLVFPTEEFLADTHQYAVLDEEEEEIWNDLFQEVIQG